MSEKELRIGNLLWCESANTMLVVGQALSVDCPFMQINGLMQTGCSIDFKCRAVQIKITEMWLEKFGFKSEGIGGNRFVLHNAVAETMDFAIETDCVLWYPKVGVTLMSWAEFKYIHQLQNLFFAITGEELTLKEEQQ